MTSSITNCVSLNISEGADREQNFQRIVVESNNTDVAVMGIFHVGRVLGLQELWLHKHTATSDAFVSCHAIFAHFEERHPNQNITGVILAAYILTGS